MGARKWFCSRQLFFKAQLLGNPKKFEMVFVGFRQKLISRCVNSSQKLFIQATVSSKKFDKEIEYEFNYTSFQKVKSVHMEFYIN